jgi:corrinoid protein of di/trimethylamine methyltransferase
MDMLNADMRNRLINAVATFDLDHIKDLAQQVLAEGIDPVEAIEQGLMVGLRKVGSDFECGTVFLPELVVAGEVMKVAMSVFQPYLLAHRSARAAPGRIVIGTVKGDIHNLGKNIVTTMLEVSGFQVLDLGVDVPVDQFVEAVEETKAQMVGMSSLMTTTVTEQRNVIEALKKAKLRDRVKVVVGGAAVTPEWAASIGADGYAGDAVTAASMVSNLLAD